MSNYELVSRYQAPKLLILIDFSDTALCQAPHSK